MNYQALLQEQFSGQIAFVERRPGVQQLVVPLFYEDGDMVDIFLEELPDGKVKIADHGMTLMRLSYAYEVDTPNKERILQKMIAEAGLIEEGGNVFVTAEPERLHPTILAYAQAVARISSMRHFRRETIASLFYEMVDEFVMTSLRKYNPSPKFLPLPERDDLEVDYRFNGRHKTPVFLFAAKDTTKTRLATISCLEFRSHRLQYKGFVVHEDSESLSRKDRSRITSAADKQFISLEDFKDNAEQVFAREYGD